MKGVVANPSAVPLSATERFSLCELIVLGFMAQGYTAVVQSHSSRQFSLFPSSVSSF